MGRPVVQFEIGAKDPQRLESFYTQLFGWSTTSEPTGYRIVNTGGGGIEGSIAPQPNGLPSYLAIYVEVDDLEQALRHAESLGARLVVGPTDLPNGRRFAMIADPEEHIVGLFAYTGAPAHEEHVATSP